MGKAYATRASRAVSKKEAVALQEEGFASMQSVFSRGSYAGLQGCGTAGLGGECVWYVWCGGVCVWVGATGDKGAEGDSLIDGLQRRGSADASVPHSSSLFASLACLQWTS